MAVSRTKTRAARRAESRAAKKADGRAATDADGRAAKGADGRAAKGADDRAGSGADEQLEPRADGLGRNGAALAAAEFTGRVRLGKRTKRLVKRLGPDDVAVIDHAAIDR